MKLFIKTTFFLALSVCMWHPLYAFVKIENVNTSDFPKIDINVTVRNDALRETDENSFLIYEDGYRVNYVKVASLPLEEFNIVFCIDSSKSMSDDFLKDIKNTAIDILNREDSAKIALYRFNDDVVLLDNFGSDRHKITSSIEEISRQGTKTLLYNAIYDAIMLLDDARAKNRAVVVFTDGMDEGSSVTVQDAAGFARESGTPVFFVSKPGSKNISERMAKLTGGKTFWAGDKSGVPISFLKNTYVIRYHSLLKRDNKTHKLEVRLAGESIKDISEFNLPWFHLVYILTALLVLLLIALIICLIFAFRNRKGKKRHSAKENYTGPAEKNERKSVTAKTIPEQEHEDELPPEGPSYSNAWLIQKDGGGTAKKFLLQKNETIIGRDKDCDIILSAGQISARHAKIKNTVGVFYLFDLISDNGTYLNSSKLLRPKPLYDWDEISIGKTNLIFRGSK